MYLKDAQTFPDAVENLRRGIALGGLDNLSSIPTIVKDDSKSTVPFATRKENRTQFTTEDTLRAVKETIQDSRYENLVRLLDKMGDRLANVVDVVEDFQRNQSSRHRNREKSNNRDRHRDGSNSIKERDRRKNQQRSGTSQRYFDNNEFCNYCGQRRSYNT